MKKIFIILVALSFTLPLFSQDNRMGEHRDKIKALKVADITDKLNLSASEAEKFWPIYNAFENDQERLRSDTFKKRNEIGQKDVSLYHFFCSYYYYNTDHLDFRNQRNRGEKKYKRCCVP